jgi:hypothetical protein
MSISFWSSHFLIRVLSCIEFRIRVRVRVRVRVEIYKTANDNNGPRRLSSFGKA